MLTSEVPFILPIVELEDEVPFIPDVELADEVMFIPDVELAEEVVFIDVLLLPIDMLLYIIYMLASYRRRIIRTVAGSKTNTHRQLTKAWSPASRELRSTGMMARVFKVLSAGLLSVVLMIGTLHHLEE